MSASAAEPRHGTRWGRALLVSAVGVVALVGMSVASYERVLGFNATLTVMNTSSTNDYDGMSFSTSRLQATDAGFGMAPMKLQNGTWKNVLRAGFGGATLSGLCVSKTESLPLVGAFTVRLYAPSGTAIKANNGVFDITDIVGDKSDIGINLAGSTQVGLTTTDITTVPVSGTSGPPYVADPFGQVPSGDSPLEIFDSTLYTSGSNLGTWPIDGKVHTFGGGWTGIDVAAADLHKIVGRLWQVQLTGQISLPNLGITVTAGNTNMCGTWPTNPDYTNGKAFP